MQDVLAEVDSYTGEQALLCEVILAAIRDAKNGHQDAIAFLCDAHGAWAESRRNWLSHTSLRDEVFRKRCCQLFNVPYVKAEDTLPRRLPPPLPRITPEPPPPACTYRTNVRPGRNLRRCNAGTRTARAIDFLAQTPATLDELVAALDCSPDQARNVIQNLTAKGYGTSTNCNGKVSLEYPQGYSRPLPHRGK